MARKKQLRAVYSLPKSLEDFQYEEERRPVSKKQFLETISGMRTEIKERLEDSLNQFKTQKLYDNRNFWLSIRSVFNDLLDTATHIAVILIALKMLHVI